MASRAIFRKQKYLVDSVNRSSCLVQAHGKFLGFPDLHPIPQEARGIVGALAHSYKTAASHSSSISQNYAGIVRHDTGFAPLGSQYVRHLSIAKAGGNDLKNRDYGKVTAPEAVASAAPHLNSSIPNPMFVYTAINKEIEEVLADYVHHPMSLAWVMVVVRLFFLIVVKDVFLSLYFGA